MLGTVAKAASGSISRRLNSEILKSPILRLLGGGPPMAWRSSGSSNTDMVENLCKNGLIVCPTVKAAFLKIDRAHYAPESPYDDRPLDIGHGARISAPHMHASAVESLLRYILPLRPGGIEDGQGKLLTGAVTEAVEGVVGRPRRVLDVGSGSGFLTHVLAELVGADGVVVGVDHIKELKEMGEANMAKSAEGRALLASGRCRFRVGDGRKGWAEGSGPRVGGAASLLEAGEGEEEAGGWDAIHVGAAAKELHAELVSQLRSPGRIFIPMDDAVDEDQYIWTVDKDHRGKLSKRRLFGVTYVPLTDAPPRGGD